MSTFSIVMLTWNNMPKFYKCIHSMFYYLMDDNVKEIIILDNGSKDEDLLNFLRKLHKQIKKIRVIFSDTNLGIGKGRKKLYDEAEGDYILSLDSDTLIINPPMLLDSIKVLLDIEDMYLVGGGGGDHPYYPTIEKEHIINKNTPEQGKFTYVDEVAGWFHSFKSKNLVKNGGKLYMDEQFSPFWAEDSDFCIQIKKLKKKCCIMGKGLISHTWSSSHKKETMTTVAGMWEKLRNKWYKDMPEYKQINVDEDFQSKYYNVENEYISTNWMIKGIMENRLPNKNLLNNLYPELEFNDDEGLLKYKNEELSIHDFIKNNVTVDNILEKCITLVEDSLKACKTLTYLTVDNEERALKVLENCEDINDLNIILMIKEDINRIQIVSKIKKLTDNFRIYTYRHLENKFKLMSCFMSTIKDFDFKTLLNLSSDSSKTFVSNLDIDNTEYQTNNKSSDLYCIELITEYIKVEKELNYSDNGDFFISKDHLYKIINCFAYQQLLNKVILQDHNIPLHVMPRVSPEHSLIRSFGYLQSKKDLSTLIIILAEIDDEEKLKEIKNLIDKFKKNDNDIMLLNYGKLQQIKTSSLYLDYYYNIKEDDNKFITWLKFLTTIDINDYSNVIFSTDGYELEESDTIELFMVKSKYKSCGYLLNDNRIDTNLFSIYNSDMNNFSMIVSEIYEKSKNNNSIDVIEEIEKNLLKLNMGWIEKI